MKKIILYTKEFCPLCDEAKEVLEDLQREFSFELELVDIYKHDHLLEKYQLMIPVVEVDGEEVGYGRIMKDDISKRLR